jgi:hypothetical protein
MGSIGHELQHALEVLSDRSVKDAASFFLFFSRVAENSFGTFETRAAVNAGSMIRREVGR